MKKPLLTFGFTCLIFTGVALAAQTAPPIPESLPSRPLHEELEELEFLDMDLLQLEPQKGVEVTDVVPWSKLVVQSYRDRNWEIYLADSDGSNPTRLTFNGVSDIHPHLNRGATRIVFVSNRTGNYEIFTMNSGGSGLAQLTSDGVDDVYPSWSPDGTKVAFQSYRDGQPEIYVMNSDGSGHTRLTWDGDYDGMPTWSPDGTKIAFVSRRTGGYRIWMMNADGSEPTQLSSQPYSSNPTWSPDSSQIAYSTDGDGDGWQELWLMNADGSDQHEIYNSLTPNTDVWARSWSPDGQYVAFTNISFIYYRDNWYWTEAKLYAWSSEHSWLTVLGDQDTDWHPGWQTTDAYAPTSSVHVLPFYSRDVPEINWSGGDIGESGLSTYDIQYRDVAGGDWTDWLTGTTETLAGFSGVGGHAYYFRSRATDNAYNVESWPLGDGDACTTLYSWVVRGTVQDNREIPVEKVAVTTIPSAFEATPSRSAGDYLAYVGDQAETYTAIWTKDGYGTLPSAGFSFLQDAVMDPVLPPADNVIDDSGFESGEFGSSRWMPGGPEPPIYVQGFGHTGHWAAVLGKSDGILCVESASNPTSYGCDYTSIQAALDAAQPGQTIWVFPGVYKGTLLQMKAGVNLRSVQGPSVTVIDGEQDGPIIFSSSNNVLVEGFTIRNGYHVFRSGGIYLRDVDSSVVIRNNRLIKNKGGTSGAMSIYYASPQIVGNWFIENRSWGRNRPEAACIISYRGSPIIANNVFWNNPAERACLSVTGLVSDTIGLVYNNTLVGNWGGIKDYPDARNNIIVNSIESGVGAENECPGILYYNDVWNNNPNYYQDCPDLTGVNGNISEDPLFVDAANGDFRLHSDSPAKDAGDPDPAFNDPDGSRNDMGAWGGPWALPEVELSPSQSWTHKWFDLTPWAGQTITVTFVLSDHVLGTALSELSQVVTLTADLSAPTLSFLYRVMDEPEPGNLGFSVVINTDLGSATEFPIQTYDEKAWIYLDEVNVGSAYPDLWVNTSDVAALPGEQTAHIIVYGNRGGAAANGVQITATLPAELFFVNASPPPVFNTLIWAWEWNIGNLPAESGPFTVVLTTTVAPTVTAFSNITSTVSIQATTAFSNPTGTVSIEVTTPELERANNVVHTTTFVGRWFFLPLITKQKSLQSQCSE